MMPASARPAVWRDNFRHLRVPFQFTLAPIFLWGCFLARTLDSSGPAWRVVAAFAAFHLLLYPGITAFNSYYDRDEGPVGGMERPPPVHRSLLALGLGCQAAGAPVAASCGRAVLCIYAAFVVLGVLYSHPSTRWKASPWLSALVVCVGQGGLGFLAGWASARDGLGGVCAPIGVLGAAAAALTTLGMYPLTQVYQVEEDARRGDRTLCVVLGEQRGLRVSQTVLLLAGTAAVAAVRPISGPTDATALALGYAALISCVGWMRRTLRLRPGFAAFRAVRALNYAGSAGFAAFILLRIARW